MLKKRQRGSPFHELSEDGEQSSHTNSQSQSSASNALVFKPKGQHSGQENNIQQHISSVLKGKKGHKFSTAESHQNFKVKSQLTNEAKSRTEEHFYKGKFKQQVSSKENLDSESSRGM